jgi:hypothetical protein
MLYASCPPYNKLSYVCIRYGIEEFLYGGFFGEENTNILALACRASVKLDRSSSSIAMVVVTNVMLVGYFNLSTAGV